MKFLFNWNLKINFTSELVSISKINLLAKSGSIRWFWLIIWKILLGLHPILIKNCRIVLVNVKLLHDSFTISSTFKWFFSISRHLGYFSNLKITKSLISKFLSKVASVYDWMASIRKFSNNFTMKIWESSSSIPYSWRIFDEISMNLSSAIYWTKFSCKNERSWMLCGLNCC